MEAKGSYVIVGIFVLLLGVAMVASLFWLAGWGRGTEETYLVFMDESVSGLTMGAPVKYRGVDVGRVAALDLSHDAPEVVQLTLSIAPETPVLTDTRAELEFQGLTGLAFINLVGGTRGAERLRAAAGQEFPVIENGPSIFARLDDGVSELLMSVTETSNQVGSLLEGIEGERLARVVANLDELTTVLAAHSGEIGDAVGSADRFFASATAATDELPQLLREVDSLTVDWRRTSSEVRAATAEGSEQWQRMSEEVAGNARLLTADLRQLVERLERVTTDIEEDPTMFLYGRPSGERGPGE